MNGKFLSWHARPRCPLVRAAEPINVGAALGPLLGAQMGAAQSTALFLCRPPFTGCTVPFCTG